MSDSLLGFALTTDQAYQILSMYSSSEASIEAVAVTPGFKVVGTFPMPITASIRLDLIGSVSDSSLTLRARLYCVTPGFEGIVPGSVVSLPVGSVIDTEVFSAVFPLVGGRIYQVHAEVTGNAGLGYFGSVRRAAPTGY